MPADLSFERGLVLRRLVGLERLCVRVPDLRERVRPLLDEIEVLRVPLLGFLAARTVVGALRPIAPLDERGVVLPEERELPRDEILEALQISSS
jgi:hypothetical protein